MNGLYGFSLQSAMRSTNARWHHYTVRAASPMSSLLFWNPPTRKLQLNLALRGLTRRRLDHGVRVRDKPVECDPTSESWTPHRRRQRGGGDGERRIKFYSYLAKNLIRASSPPEAGHERVIWGQFVHRVLKKESATSVLGVSVYWQPAFSFSFFFFSSFSASWLLDESRIAPNESEELHVLLNSCQRCLYFSTRLAQSAKVFHKVHFCVCHH